MRRRAQEAKQQEDQDSRTPMSLTRLPALLTSQSEMSWLKAVAPENMPFCESRRSGDVLLLMIGVVAILDKDKNGVRPLLV